MSAEIGNGRSPEGINGTELSKAETLRQQRDRERQIVRDVVHGAEHADPKLLLQLATEPDADEAMRKKWADRIGYFTEPETAQASEPEGEYAVFIVEDSNGVEHEFRTEEEADAFLAQSEE